MKTSKKRCPWPLGDALMMEYHDKEWGTPVRDDLKIFEFLILESFQAGLSWRIILNKRQNFRKAFKNFDYRKIAKFGAKDRSRLLKDAGIVRNRLKIQAAIENAKRFMEVQKEFGTFSKYMWGWVKGKPILHRFKSHKDYPAVIEEAEAWSKDLKKRGFRFLGPTVVYAHMQAVGMANDHTVDCFRHKKSKKQSVKFVKALQIHEKSDGETFMPSCLGCGDEMTQISRKLIKGEVAAGHANYKAVYQCKNEKCAEKGAKKSFLDDGMMFIPLPDGK